MDGSRIATENEYDALCWRLGSDDNINQKKVAFEVEHHVVVSYEKAAKNGAKPTGGQTAARAHSELSEASCTFITGLVRNKQLASGRFWVRLLAKLMRALYALEQGYLSDDALEPLSGGTLMDDLDSFDEEAGDGTTLRITT